MTQSRKFCSRKRKTNIFKILARHKLTNRGNFIPLHMQGYISEAYEASNSSAPRQAQFDTDSRSIKLDNCATRSISPNLEDFVDIPVETNWKLKGIGGQVAGIRIGTMKITIEDDEGMPHSILLPGSYYIPEAKVRLLSPQHWAKVANDHSPLRDGTWCATYGDRIVAYWGQRRYKKTCYLDYEGTNTATIRTRSGFQRYALFCSQCGPSVLDEDDPIAYDASQITDDEGSDSEIETDEIEGSENGPSVHMDKDNDEIDFTVNFGKEETPVTHIIESEDSEPRNHAAEFLRWHHRLGHLSPAKMKLMSLQGDLPRYLAKCETPMCTACLYGKQTRKPWRSKAPKNEPQLSPLTAAGQCVSVDQLESKTPGLLGQLRGIPTKQRYRVATVFVDQYSRLSYTHLQTSTSATETIEGKLAFEQYAAHYGVRVKHYHADNGVFADKLFRQACKDRHQTLSFSGVNAHWMNGVAERRIRELQNTARTMLIHASRRWDAVSPHLWPYAIRMANDVLNSTPDLQRKTSPKSLFSGITTIHDMRPKDWHPFGAPVYALDNRLQSGSKIPKWSERSRLGIYLGKSPHHARNVALVLSNETGLVSPQFHILIDNRFETMRAENKTFFRSTWQEKCHFHNSEPTTSEGESQPLPQPSTFDPTSSNPTSMIFPSAQQITPQIENPTEEREILEQRELPSEEREVTFEHAQNSNPIRRSTRRSKAPERLIEALASELEEQSSEKVAYEVLKQMGESDLNLQHIPRMALTATADPDTMYYHEAIKQPDRAQFIEAMKKEVSDQENNGNWIVVPRETIPKGYVCLPAVWAMKRKRKIVTGEVYKWKARLNIDGSKQEHGRDYWETYAPVASWPIVRLLLIMGLIMNWKTYQVDFVLAYPQAPVGNDFVYMEIPKGFQLPGDEDLVLKIQKNIYGRKDAGRIFHQYLKDKLESIGFKQSVHDECVFYHGSVVYVTYVDDSIIQGPDDEEIQEVLRKMKLAGLDYTIEGGIDDFLGVNIDRREDGTINFTQPQLINSILDEVGLKSDSKTKDIPALSSRILKRHLNSPDFDGSFDYRSIVGKLNYLEKSTRPDISYQVHMCARFSANPKMEHGQAIKHLCRYLLATKDKGIIFKPTNESFDVMCDADFAGNWEAEGAVNDPDTARSRSGFIISYAGCPVSWSSKLATTIALSSTESEYECLSSALRETIPLMRIVQEMNSKGFGFKDTIPKVHCRVFEDNNGALEIATNHKIRPRTKHINVKFHHFHQHVKSGLIKILPIDTKDQLADILTKPVDISILRKLRKKLMGWDIDPSNDERECDDT